MIKGKYYIQAETTLDHKIFDNTLEGQLKSFVIACKSNDLAAGTIEFYAYRLAPFVDFCQERKALSPAEVTPTLVRLFFIELNKRVSPYTAQDSRRAVKRFFNWLIEEEVLPEGKNPVKGKGPHVPEPLIIPFTAEDVRRMLLVCNPNTFHGSRDAAVILVFMDTGLRRAEIAGIQLADVNTSSNTIKVMGKGRKERIVGIGKLTMKAIFNYIRQRKKAITVTSSALWVNDDGEGLTVWGIREIIERVCRRAEISGVRCSPHTFRHYFATNALINGAKDWEVQLLLGHTTMKMTQRYRRTLNAADAVSAHRGFSPADKLYQA